MQIQIPVCYGDLGQFSVWVPSLGSQLAFLFQGKPGDDGKPGLNGKNVSDGPDPHPLLEKWGFRPDRQGIVLVGWKCG